MVPANRPTNGCSSTLRICEISISGNDCSSHGRPEPRDEKKPRYRQRRGGECHVQRRLAPQLEARTHKEDRADDRRISSKPMPGQPPANVEYRRRNTYLDTIIRSWRRDANPPRGGGCDSLGSLATGSAGAPEAAELELDDAPLEADDRRVRPVVGVEFRQECS